MEFFDSMELEFFDSMNMVEHEAVVREEETIPAYSEQILATGPLYSPVNFDFHLQVQPTSPFVDRPLSPPWNFQDNNYDFSARGGHSIRTTEVQILVDEISSLPNSIKESTTLKWLHIRSCRNLLMLPELPTNLSNLKQMVVLTLETFVSVGLANQVSYDREMSNLFPLVIFTDLFQKIVKTSLLMKQICDEPLEVTSLKVLEEAISAKISKFSGDNKLDSNHESPQGPQDYPNGGDMVQIDSSVQQPTVEFDVRHNGGNIVIMGESENAKKISKRKHRNTETLLSPELLQQLKGRMTLDEIAECTGASRSSLKRFCRKHEIPRWPRKRNESVQGVEGAPSQACLANDPLNDAIGQPAKLNKSNQQNLSLAFRQTELSPSAPYCVSNTLASMQPQISAERMLTEVPGCPENLKFLHHSKKGKGVLESNETVWSCSNPSPEHTVASVAPTMPQVIAMQDVSTMTIKVRYRRDILKFPLSFSSGKGELEEKISKRLELKLGTFRIKYRDADGDWISITCDEDLQLCMGDSKQLGNSTIIMSVES